ncbi:MAG: glycosyltransferase family 39 protein [candidate division WOR-3 bacterium]
MPRGLVKSAYNIIVLLAFLLAFGVIVWGNQIFYLTPFFKNMVIKLYIGHLLRGIIALPFFLVWLKLSKNPRITRVLNCIKAWWLAHPLTPVIAPVFFLLLTLLISLFGFNKIPMGDAVWPFFQAKIFAQGRLFAPAPPDFRFFATPTIVYQGKWFSYTSPGHSLILLPFYLLGTSWLCGPILGTIGIILFYQLVKEYTDRETARIALLLAVTSPWMLFLFASHEFHITSTFFTILALYGLTKMSRLSAAEPRTKNQELKTICGWAFLAGLSLGMVFLARPYTAIGIGIPIILFVIKERCRVRILDLCLILFFVGGLIMVLLHLYYNRSLTGNWLTFPYQLMGKYHGIGFSLDYGAPTFNLPGHSPLKMFLNLAYNIFVLSLQLFGWLFLSLMFFFPGIIRSESKRLWFFWAPALGLIVAYCFYWFHGITPWGPKYWSEALPALILFSAIGIKSAPNNFSLRALPFLTLFSLLVHLPANFIYFSSGRWGETPKVWQNVRAAKIRNAVVFVKTDERSGHFDYTSAFIFNDPFLKGDIIFARDLGVEENLKFLEKFPGRSAYSYEFNTGRLTQVKTEVEGSKH